MKRIIVLLVLGVVLSTWGAVCPEDGDDGMRGQIGSSGTDGTDGADAVVNTWSYEFNATVNPEIRNFPVIDLTKVESGVQTVAVFILVAAGQWQELPFSRDQAGAHVEHGAIIGHQFVTISTEIDGVLSPGAALTGADCKVIVKEFNQ